MARSKSARRAGSALPVPASPPPSRESQLAAFREYRDRAMAGAWRTREMGDMVRLAICIRNARMFVFYRKQMPHFVCSCGELQMLPTHHRCQPQQAVQP